MVFESLVSDLLNRFIGDYVENLDKSQLKIGIWGGNVVLENLRVKENALSEFDVPFKVKAGQIGKLTLKIPWKNLYSEAVVATLDGLYLLVVPGATIKYDPVKEERYLQEAKQKELQRIEETLQLVARREKPQEEKKDTFAEKLATQVIKNLQVKITSIHIRYEDDVSDPQRPLAMGMTLSELSLQTADENWKTCILNEAAKIIYKLCRLECFCAYWNVNSPIFYRGSWKEIVDNLKAGISTKNEELQGYQYIFKPIFASARMCINPNAEVELKSPKANLHLEVQNIAIEMTKPQYLSMVDLLESIDCMVKNGPYRKFRPDVPVHRNTRLWWKYSINSILEVHIRRFNQMWDWNNIKKHRNTLKAYKAAYKIKLTQGKVREDTEKQIQELEKVLDVFNIVLARQQVQMEVVRSGQKLVAKKDATQKQSGGGFFSSFFGKKEGKKKEEEEDKEPESIDSIMTPEEKTKLYTAIGYSGSSHNLALPKHYVAVIVNFKLLSTSVTIREEPGVPEILKVQMIDLSTSISQRPGAQAIRVEAKLEHWSVTGLQQQGKVPSLIASVGGSDSSLLSVLFELNPEDSTADQLLRVHSQPVEIIYDALTVISITEFFKTGKGVDLEVITSATLSKLEEIKEKTATGLSHIIETRKVLDLRIDLKPSYLLLPKSGFHDGKSDLMIVDFGYLQLNSVDQGTNQQVSASFSSLEEIMDRAYERFSLELRSVQILYSKSGEEWENARLKGISHQHILQPMDFTLQLAKCMVDKDSRMPRFKVSGELPLLHVKISDQKIQGVLELVDSIPLPQSTSSPPSTPTEKVLGKPLSDARPKVLGLDPTVLSYTVESDSDEDTSEKSADDDSLKSTLEELTEVQFQFEVKAVLLELTRQAAQEDVVLALNVSQLGAKGKMRTFDLTVTSYLRKISLDYCEIKDAQNQPLHLMTSSDKHGSDLLKVEYIKADVSGPSFHTLFNNTEQTLKVEFSSLDFLLHTKALLSTINYMNSAIPQDLTASKERETQRQAESAAAGKTVSKGSKDSGVVNFKLSAVLGSFRVSVCDDRSNIADIRVQGIDASVVVQAKETEVCARLRDIVVLDVDPKTIHKKAVSIVGEEVFSFKMTLYPGATEGEGYTDTSKVDGRVILRLGCIQIVYLHKFLVSLLMFVDNFQTAKEALSAATAQAAEKAASSVRDFAQKSFRLAMNIRLKAPLIIIPQSSTSHNAVEADLGLITVENSFSLLPVEGRPLPAVIDNMDIQLTQLKLSRISMEQDSNQPSLKLLEPVNLVLSVKRNLAASWYQKMAAIEVDGDLKPMKVALSQDDLTVLLRILMENIGEASSDRSDTPIGSEAALKQESVLVSARAATDSEVLVEKLSESKLGDTELLESVKFSFNVESLGLTLYSNDPAKPSVHEEQSCLGEFMLCKMKTLGKMFTNGNMEVSTILTTCTLDDRRCGIQRVTSRMLGRRDEETSEPMIDMTYSQSADERSVVAVLQKLYLCASVEFLLAVADFFVQALPSSPPTQRDKTNQLPLRYVSEPKIQSEPNAAPRTRLRAIVVDPEIVFVANLMKADAPALVASFQCDFSFLSEDTGQAMKANIRSLKVLACPFIRTEGDKAETTVLRPCSVELETKMPTDAPLTGSVTVEEFIVKISPIILNTVITITAAMAPQPKEEPSQQTSGDLNSLWSLMNVANANYWFLGVDTASEVTESFKDVNSSKDGESFEMKVKVVQVTLESGLGHRTVPLLLAESSFTGTAQNWSSLLSVSADMTLEVNYFNETHAVWEPLLERVDNGKRRWNLKLDMKNNPVRDKSPVPGDDFIMLPDPRTAITICSKDTMNITVSKCCLTVFINLAKAFSESTASTFDHSLKEKSPYTIRNALGIPLIVQHSANLRLTGSSSLGKLHELAVDKSVDFEHSSFERSSPLSALQRQESCLFNLSIVPSGYSEIPNIPLGKPGRRLYNVRGPMQRDAVSVLLQIDASEGNKVITVRSPLQIKNHFSVPFAILKYSSELGGMVNVGVAEPEKECHVPLEAYRSQLFLLPVGPLEHLYGASTTCIAWKEQVHVSLEVQAVLQCPATESSFLPLVVNTLAVPDDLSHIGSHEQGDWDPAYVIHLHPAVTLKNLLPYSIRYLLEGSADFSELQEGSSADVLNSNVGGELMKLVLIKYHGRNWNGNMRISKEMPEFLSISFTCDTQEGLTVDLCVHVSRVNGKMVLSVYSPYWIINKTSRVLQYRAEDTYVKHPSDFRDVILFSFKKKNFFNKNKLQLCVSTSSWSNGFSLDTVGSYGCVRCPNKSGDYLVGVSIQMSSFNLTRIVTMSPFYTLVNKSSFELEVGEVQNNNGFSCKWHYISSTECLPFWPEASTGKLCVRVVGSESSSKSFFFNKQDNGTLLRMEQYGGVIVDVNIADHSTVISFTDYYDGAAPALVLNHTTAATVNFRQRGCEESWALRPGEAQRFAWDDPAGERKLCWSCEDHSGELDLVKDECGQFAYSSLVQIYWVSFLDGRQRVLIFTEDVGIVSKAQQAEALEQSQQEVNISLKNLGLSLINNDIRQEIAYVGITSSGVVWEMRPKNRWKSFNHKNIGLLEKAYQDHINSKSEPGWTRLETGLEVNFGRFPMVMRQPFSSPIRRNFLPGIRIELKQSPHQRSLRAQLYWLQVDNQLPGAIFPTVFHPVPLPKSIVQDSEPKPFIDVSIITRFNEHSQVMQFKYFMALVQEMAVKIDQGFLGAILALFTPATDSQDSKERNKLIEKDLEALQAQLMESSMTDTSGLSFFEHFHISPIKLHLSLSLGSSGDESEQGDMVAIQSVNLLLKSIGATLTDVDDLIFKLAYFEVKYQFYRREKLMWTVIRHYSEQFLTQMYVLVLGLDVLGNPFGLIRGLSEGVEAFFYEPIQGAVQGPEEFAEGFVIGVRSLLGHTVGGAAGMVSRITGTVGKGLAAITMDKEYQQKRREEMNRPTKDFGESLAKGGKGFLKGVVGGVTGIVTKPVEGAKKEGAAGFFKGVGKGLVGVVARPTGGIIDMASSTFQGIQRVAESTEEVTKLRPVRLIQEDGIIRPYDHHESEGYDLFQRSEIKQLKGEIFREHYVYPGRKKTNIIITNRRVMCVKEIDVIGHFNKEWECKFENFQSPPSTDGGDLKIYYREHNKLNLIRKDGQTPVKVIHMRHADMAERLRQGIDSAQFARTQYRMARQKSQRFIKMGNI
ncbi:vacuolar protein sorting-associated protein 13C-like isoform X6 [Carassius auratus]|uniref:Vacuolar protein sorting-associated protein 13C-like isoform X6 n=1 Tax=Carassius auratus TaxID=7957 RepID=A0A6P6KLX8_CARAU|nr:vacuolar protein sorting-associated protein 13C-like isoform X6 [Carassius auratus]